MIAPFRGKFHVEYYSKPASTAFAIGDMVEILSTVAGAGTLAKVTSSSTRCIGTMLRAVASTDADYASVVDVPVLVGDADSEFVFDVSTGTAVLTDVGEMIDFDDENSVNVNAYTTGQILVTRVLSTTQVVGKLNKGFGKEVPITA